MATPIGNLSDITLRGLDVLAGADAVACEDTRVTGKLLSYYGLKKKLLVYNDHATEKQREEILAYVREGKTVALVSDAGTPLVSDPGYKLVQAALDEGLAVIPIPGANAPLPALQLSGLPSDQFCFIGFLPPKTAAREKFLGQWKDAPAPIIAYETAPRLQAALEGIYAALGDRDMAVVREITKLYEETRRGKVSELIAHYKVAGDPKGEIVLVIGAGEKEFADPEVLLRAALQTMGTKEAAAHVAEKTGRPKKELYDLALKISHEG